MKTYVCKSCGANILINDEVSFTTCLYCGNNIAICDKTINDLNIKKIIPFEIDKEEAIENFKELLNFDVLDAKKVYVPVRYCDYNFDFLMYYRYEVSDSDDNSKYYDAEQLIDGDVKNEFIFGNSKVQDICCTQELRNKERLNFDPVLLKDVSIEYSTFSSTEEVSKKIDSDIYDYSYNEIRKRRKVVDIYSINYYSSDLKIEDFTTLIPVYIVKTPDGAIFNMPGTKFEKALKVKSIKQKVIKVLGLALAIYTIWAIYEASKYSRANMTGPTFAISSLILVVPIAILLIYFYKRSDIKKKKTYDNFDFNIYSFGEKRKKIK